MEGLACFEVKRSWNSDRRTRMGSETSVEMRDANDATNKHIVLVSKG